MGARPSSPELERWQAERAAGATVRDQARAPVQAPSKEEARAAVQALEERRGGSNIVSNTLLLVGVVLVFVVIMIETTKDAPVSVSPFEGGPAPSMAGGGAPAPPKNSGSTVDGTVTLAPGLADRAPRGATLFITVRNAGGGDRGPPLAVKRFVDPSFPVSFSIGASDVMMQGTPFVGPFDVSARLDQDGNAMTRDPSDLVSTPLSGVMPGAAAIDVLLERTLAEAPVAPAPPSTTPTAAPIGVTVELAPEVSSPAGATLFVFARRTGAAGGSPLAVKRIADPTFPAKLELGPSDVMVPGTAFEGPLDVEARLDQDGNVMSRAPGDLTGPRATGISPGASSVKVVLDTRQP